MPRASQTLLCRYQYDALSRLTLSASSTNTNAECFYLKDRLVTEIHGPVQRSIMQYKSQLLAQQQRTAGAVETSFLATDQQRSVLSTIGTLRPHHFAYSPYGYLAPAAGIPGLLAFNGERNDPLTGHYLLGKGYRAFNPVLRRFNSPDYLSPFERGGLNAYAYCLGDPVNRSDPNGHWSFLGVIRSLFRSLRDTTSRFNAFKRATRSPFPTSYSATSTEVFPISGRNTANPKTIKRQTSQTQLANVKAPHPKLKPSQNRAPDSTEAARINDHDIKIYNAINKMPYVYLPHDHEMLDFLANSRSNNEITQSTFANLLDIYAGIRSGTSNRTN